MAKTTRHITKGDRITNTPLEDFLLQLSVEKALRERYSSASPAAKRTMLKTEFEIGDDTIEALVDREEPGAVKARFGFSDQQGTEPLTASASGGVKRAGFKKARSKNAPAKTAPSRKAKKR